MTKDELDKYLAHLPARNMRRGGTPPPTSTPHHNKTQSQHDTYKSSTRSSFGVRGPRGLSKATSDLPRRTSIPGSFVNGNGSSNDHRPNDSTANIDTTNTNYKQHVDITTLMDGINLNESNNHSITPSDRVKNDRGQHSYSTITGKQAADSLATSNTGKHELEQSNIYGSSSTTTRQPPDTTHQSNNQADKVSSYSTQQQPKTDTMPPIPTFSFGSVNTSNDDPIPPIPIFSFGIGDNYNQQGDNDTNNDGDGKNILNLALGLRCGGCDKLISGMAITAAGHRWHADCFKCQHCHQDLEHVAFYEKDGQPYCALDYHELFTTRCQYCHTPIEEKSIHALGKYYHVGHFFCRECGKPFDENSTFMEHEGHPYCEKDYLAKFAHKCKGCKEDITNDFLEALDGKWHMTCFVCVDCGKAFESNTFYVRNDLPYCELHSRRIKKPA